ncbi:NADH dehydrogenase subunit E [Salana multivorans]|uniref:NADH dehydrogenase subunit E n=1 Tax=Salana multivorans TaxID=120377 RepID=A0A3N2D8P1_9MICO|nr:NADH dehydrogenase subunit E [Salana multivorans]
MTDDLYLADAMAASAVATPSGGPSGYDPATEARLREDSAAIIARYPEPRSALLPMLHLIQSVDSFVSPRGIALCAELLDLSRAEVSAVATFYSQYKRKPNGSYTVGVCTNTLCAVMGGDAVYDAVSSHLGIGNDETTDDGAITLERIECNAACDYAPVVMVNWEFFDNMTPARAVEVVDELRSGTPVRADRGPVVQDFRSVSRVLAGFEDGLVDDGPAGGAPTLVGLEISRERHWAAPAYPAGSPGAEAAAEPRAATGEPTSDATTAEAADDAGVGGPGSSAEHAEPIGEAEASGADNRGEPDQQGETSGSES